MCLFCLETRERTIETLASLSLLNFGEVEAGSSKLCLSLLLNLLLLRSSSSLVIRLSLCVSVSTRLDLPVCVYHPCCIYTCSLFPFMTYGESFSMSLLSSCFSCLCMQSYRLVDYERHVQFVSKTARLGGESSQALRRSRL